ncbi:MAG: hypothetical protein H7Y03_00890 [Chitinophagaceae bacterium]|nr:hypothetical protein [Chitinophagaceae bacterium]
MQKLIHHTVVAYVALLILIRMFAMPLVCVEYALNKEYIAANFCENKNKPQIHCNGECHLKKQLTKTNDAAEKPDRKGNEKTVNVDFVEEIRAFSFNSQTAILPVSIPAKASFLVTGYKREIFHPPGV